MKRKEGLISAAGSCCEAAVSTRQNLKLSKRHLANQADRDRYTQTWLWKHKEVELYILHWLKCRLAMLELQEGAGWSEQ